MSSENKKEKIDYIKREEWAQDLAALGGDPSFLPDGFNEEDEWYSDAVGTNDSLDIPSMSLLGLAGIPSVVAGTIEEEFENEEDEDFIAKHDNDDVFEWDGVENEDAYYD